MQSYEEMVLEFHSKYRHFRAFAPILNLPGEVKALRIKLITEEFGEMIQAYSDKDLIGFADGIADLIYVLIGAAVTFGIPIDRIFREVHRSNMTKTVPEEVKLGEKYGVKTPKGPDYIPPDIQGILFNPYVKTKLELKHEL